MFTMWKTPLSASTKMKTHLSRNIVAGLSIWQGIYGDFLSHMPWTRQWTFPLLFEDYFHMHGRLIIRSAWLPFAPLVYLSRRRRVLRLVYSGRVGWVLSLMSNHPAGRKIQSSNVAGSSLQLVSTMFLASICHTVLFLKLFGSWMGKMDAIYGDFSRDIMGAFSTSTISALCLWKEGCDN